MIDMLCCIPSPAAASDLHEGHVHLVDIRALLTVNLRHSSDTHRVSARQTKSFQATIQVYTDRAFNAEGHDSFDRLRRCKTSVFWPHLHVDVEFVHYLGDFFVFEALVLHHMTPMASR